MYYINMSLAQAIKEKGRATTRDFAFLDAEKNLFCMFKDCAGNYYIETTLNDAQKIAKIAATAQKQIDARAVGIFKV